MKAVDRCAECAELKQFYLEHYPGHTTAQCGRDDHNFVFPIDSMGASMTFGRYCSNCDRCENCYLEDRARERH